MGTRLGLRALMAGVEHDATPAPKLAANNTVIYYREGSRVVRLYETDVLAVVGRNWRLNSGGHRTVTTKDRLNRFLAGYRVASVNGDWRVYRSRDGAWWAFYDAMLLPIL